MVWDEILMDTWIFLRGLTRESRHWGSFPEQFANDILDTRVFTPDLPGNGRLNTQKSPLHAEEMAENIRAQLIEQGIRPPYHVLAISLGAMVAVAWATRYPEEIRSGVLINTSLRPFSPFYRRLKPANYLRLLKLVLLGACDRDWERTIFELTSHKDIYSEDLLDHWVAYRREYPVSSNNVFRQIVAAARYRAPLVKPPFPILILTSKEDVLVDTSCSQQLAMQWNTDFAEHYSAGHDLPLDDSTWVVKQIKRWLAAESPYSEI